jgi:DNA-binding SARP family transcriptional activator/Flp pilus assembly protein TadD
MSRIQSVESTQPLIRLLGQIAVRTADGTYVCAGPAKQGCTLAVLALRAGQLVSVDGLIDRVWDEAPPRAARASLHSYVARLRKLLEGDRTPDAGPVLARRSGGYVLAVEPEQVDVHLMRTLGREGRKAAERQDYQAAGQLYRRAAELWSGEALGSLGGGWVARNRAGLHQERLGLLAELYETELRTGQHEAVLPELAKVVADHPLDERLAGQYLLALYRCGRPADALTHYERTREQLAEELGTDPSSRLQELHQQILTAAPALSAPATATPVPVPRQLPAPPPLFIGRSQERARLDRGFEQRGDRVVIATVGGPGGIGKTWLVLRWAHDHLADFPDGQLYVDLLGFDPSKEPLAAEAALQAFLGALGVEPGAIPADAQSQTGLYRSLTADRRLLVVLDNARSAAQVLPLIPGSARCGVLVTSRNQLVDVTMEHGADHLTLDVLDEHEARQLLTTRLGRDRTAAEPEAVSELLTQCAGLPLALGLVTARGTLRPDSPLALMAEDLREAAGRLDTLEADTLDGRLRAAFTSSYRALSTTAAYVFGLLGLAPGPDIGQPAVARLTALPVPRVRAALQELIRAHLLREDPPGRYRMHDLLRLYAVEQARRTSREEDGHVELRRLVDFYLHTARGAEQLLHPHRIQIGFPEPSADCDPQAPADQAAALAWLEVEHSGLLAAQRLAVDLGWYDVVWRIAWVLDTFHRRNGHLHAQLAAWHEGLEATRRLGDPVSEMLAHRNLGVACIRSNLHDEALDHLHQALSLTKRSGDIVQAAHTHLVLAYAWERRGNDQQALGHADHALTLFQTLEKTPVWEAQAHNQICLYSARLGRYEQARAHGESSLALFRRHQERDGEADALGTLGRLAHLSGQHDLALSRFEQALGLLRDISHTYGEAETLDWLGRVHAALGERDQARRCWGEALSQYLAQHRVQEAQRVRDRLSGSPRQW